MAFGAALGTLVCLTGVAFWRAFNPHDRAVLQQGAPDTDVAQFVGSTACVSCHAPETKQWRTSQHRAAMSEATNKSVLGDFNDATFTYAGTPSRFFMRDGRYFVRTDGHGGQPTDFQVRYTFGVYPLQQYLVEFSDGRLQPLPIAWDARPAQDGGQRWFHLYPGQGITSADDQHWSRPAQNWNHMCADCHSTAVRKNYDAVNDQFRTQWAETGVGCEACHGPASRHLVWAKGKRPNSDSAKGLTVHLGERRNVIWTTNPNTGHPARSGPRTTDMEIQVCAQCHSRRGQIADGYEAGKPLLDYYLPALLTRELYHPDGQQRGEVYTWGTFVQSRMYANGVTCSDCHNPHDGKLRSQQSTNAVCTNCHLRAKYDTPTHHNHRTASAGASCASCHMPTTTYMQVDARHDHSIRVPRPDLSVKFATPNACANCHADRGNQWAAARVEEWTGSRTANTGYQRIASAFAASDAQASDAQTQLRQIAADASLPPIARATALADLGAPDRRESLAALGVQLHDPSPLVRLGALQSASLLPPELRADMVGPLLSDSLRAIRVDAVGVLGNTSIELLRIEHRSAFERAAAEFVSTQRYNADRADARTNLGNFFAERGDFANAEQELLAAMRLDPFFTPAYVNLADVYRVLRRDVEGERLLHDAIAHAPASAALHHARGLALARLNRVPDAIAELHQAAVLEPDNPDFAYGYAVALHSSGKVRDAIASLERASARRPNDEALRSALVSMRQDARGIARARGGVEPRR